MIETTAALEEACRKLAQSDFITIDTEFLRETTFWPELCLIQMASPDLEVIVDPLAKGLDLAPFFALMADASVTKVFHAARQDIEIIFHLGNLIPHPIFDTQVAAMVCGFGDSVSYDQLVQKVKNVHIDKTSRFTDWSRRPLSDKQLDYALADVTHLRDVYLKLTEEMDREGRAGWLTEEMSILESRETYDLHPDDAWQRLKMRLRKPQELAVMQYVAAWREREARSRDVPRSRVMKDDALVDIAVSAPRSVEAMGRMRSIPNGFERSRAGADILAAVERGLARDPDTIPAFERPRGRNNASAVLEMLKVLLKGIAETARVAPKILATVDDLEAIASDDNADVPALKGWRRELFGEPALKLKHGKLAIAIDGNRVIVIER